MGPTANFQLFSFGMSPFASTTKFVTLESPLEEKYTCTYTSKQAWTSMATNHEMVNVAVLTVFGSGSGFTEESGDGWSGASY